MDYTLHSPSLLSFYQFDIPASHALHNYNDEEVSKANRFDINTNLSILLGVR